MAKKSAVFLDRDGVINQKAPEGDYIKSVEEFFILPQAGEAIKMLNEAGLAVVIITNQHGIGKGLYTHEILGEIHSQMHQELSKAGAKIDGIYYCPHKRDECQCRKPSPQMVHQAAQELGLDLENSFFVGDSTVDIVTGEAAGLKTILVQTGNAGLDGDFQAIPHFRVKALYEAAELILKLI